MPATKAANSYHQDSVSSVFIKSRKISITFCFYKTFTSLFLLCFFVFCGNLICFSQQQFTGIQQTNNQPPKNYLSNSAAFKQEIARMEINVVRDGKKVLPITQVPRVQKNDVIKVRLLDEAINGIKPDQSNWDWSFLVAFVNPSRNTDKEKSVSKEIRFRKSGWYKEYSFVVPYDSQPVFFLYPKPKYRAKILEIINKKYAEVQKLGEKTIEIAGAYAQIGSFLNELQGVLYQTQYNRYGSFVTYPKLPNSTIAGSSNNNSIYPYGNIGNNYSSNIGNQLSPIYNYNAFLEQTIERLAQSFNIQLPSCWQTVSGGISYGNIYGSSYGNSYGSNAYGAAGNLNLNNFGFAVSPDLIGRAQCVAKNIRIEDFDLSVSRLLKEGGIFALTQLRDKYPQLAYYISIAAAAIDFIVKVFQKSPLRIVPTIVSTSNNSLSYNNSSNAAQQTTTQNSVKISLFAESQPSEQGFVTAYPIVVQKWQSDSDPEVIALPTPILLEPCLHVGQNILKNIDLSEDPTADTFSKDFKLVLSSSNSFRKEFPLKKNIGMGGWELNISPEDMNQIPKINMTLEAEIAGTRGFNEIRSPKFNLPISISGTWQIKPESQKEFSVGGKRIIMLQNALGGCRCLQSVAYKPSFGGQFVFDANSKESTLQFSDDGKEVSFEIDATGFQPGQGQLELKTYGGAPTTLSLKLYPQPPTITDFKIARGDNQAAITGERLEQLQFIKINGKKAKSLSLTAPGENQNPNQKAFIFEDSNAKQTDGVVSLELGLEDDRTYQYPKTFTSSPARPAIAASELNEIEGVFINKNMIPKSQFDLSHYPVIPIDAAELSIVVQNKLADYDFKQENIQIETRIEKSQPGLADFPKASFEVLDTNTLRLNFTFNEQIRKFIGGRRLQFRILDKERGDSDWYTIKQTFVRIPQIESVKCTADMNGQCQIVGNGIDYIQQVSVDGGATWFPQEPSGLTAQPIANSQTMAMIPFLQNKKLLQIKLRDFPNTEGIIVTDYVFNNLTGTKVRSNPSSKKLLPVAPHSNLKVPKPIAKP